MLRRLALFAAVIVLVACPTARPTWWKYQSNVLNQGRAQADGATPTIRFATPFAGDGVPQYLAPPVLWSSPNHKSFGDARVLVGSTLGLRAVLPTTGQQTIIYSPTATVSTAASAPLSGGIFGTSTDGHVFALSDDLKQERWKVKPLGPSDSSLTTSPTILGSDIETQLVIVGIGQVVFALKSTDGSTQWSRALDTDISYGSCPVVSSEAEDPFVYVAAIQSTGGGGPLFGGHVVKLNAWTGARKWEHSIPGVRVFGHLMLDARLQVYVPGDNGTMYVLDSTDGSEVYKYETHDPGLIHGASLSHDLGTVYFATNGGVLYGFDANNHNQTRRVQLPSRPTTPPAVTPAGLVYMGVGTYVGNAALVAIDQSTVLWSVPMPGLVRGLAVGEEGSIYCAAGQTLIAIK